MFIWCCQLVCEICLRAVVWLSVKVDQNRKRAKPKRPGFFLNVYTFSFLYKYGPKNARPIEPTSSDPGHHPTHQYHPGNSFLSVPSARRIHGIEFHIIWPSFSPIDRLRPFYSSRICSFSCPDPSVSFATRGFQRKPHLGDYRHAECENGMKGSHSFFSRILLLVLVANRVLVCY